MEENENSTPVEVNSNAVNFTQEITLDFNSNNAYTVVSAKQADTGRWLKVYLTKNNIPYKFESGHTFYIRVRKPDGFAVVDPVAAHTPLSNSDDASEYYLAVQLSGQMTAASGRGYADIVEQDSQGNIISSIGFILNIMASPSVGEVSSSNEFAALSSLITQANMLFACAPTIGNVAGTASYKYWLRWSEDNNQFENTGVYAEGKDGENGKSPIIDTTSHEWQIYDDEQEQYVSTGIIAEGAAARITNVTATITNTVGVPSVAVDVNGSDSNRSFAFNFINIKGEKGDTGAPGAGGVSWVDGIEGTSERRYRGETQCFSPSLRGISLDGSNNKLISWTGDENFSYDHAKSYLKIGFSNASTTPAVNYYEVSLWSTPIGGSNAVTALTLREAFTATLPTIAYLWGQQGDDSGDVILQAVSYSAQSRFKVYTISGEPSYIPITSDMQAAARSNIDAMKNVLGVSSAAPTVGQIIGYSETDWQAYNPEEILHELSYGELLMITQNYVYTAAPTLETNS